MRLLAKEIDAIKSSVFKYDQNARIFLFGSRTDDRAKGGDIDLLVESKSLTFHDKISILVDIKGLIGEQKIDLLLTKTLDTDQDPFLETIRDTLVEL